MVWGNLELRREATPSILFLLLGMLTLVFVAFPVEAVLEPEEVYDSIVRVIPETVELGPGGVIGRAFTVAVTVEALTPTSGFDIEFGWNTTYLEYANHTVTVPVEDYPDPIPPSPYGGFLHAPKLLLADNVDAGAYDSHKGDARYLGNCDMDSDWDIDIYDIVIAADNYGRSW